MKKKITVYIPEERGRNKTAARGFWYSKDSRRTYYDYITAETYEDITPDILKTLCAEYKQEAIFYVVEISGEYTETATAYVYTAKTGAVDILRTKKTFTACGKKNLKATIKELLQRFGGLTVFNNGGGLYSIEAWQEDRPTTCFYCGKLTQSAKIEDINEHGKTSGPVDICDNCLTAQDYNPADYK
jgi:hypothetical protein